MTFKIHYEVNGHHDVIVITGDTIEEIREEAIAQLNARGVDISTAWSEETTE